MNFMNNQITEKFTENAQKNVDAMYNIFSMSLDNFEKLATLHLSASRKLLEDSSQTIKDVLSATSPKEAFDHMNQLAVHTIENSICNCRDTYDVVAAMQTKLGHAVEEHISTAQQHIHKATEALSNANPGNQTNFMNETLKSWINGANQAFNNASKMTSQVTDFANNNIKAAATATAQAVKKTANSKNS